jgi:uncharacterized protein YmfQ (DUF2313 family)
MSDAADRFIRRAGDDYADALAALLPEGSAWPREPDATLMKTVRGLAEIFGYVDGRFMDLLEREADPRFTIEMLADWERAAGLPDPCIAEPLTIPDRQRALVERLTALGRQDRDYFIGIAAAIGYSVRITEYSPFMVGVSNVGDTRPTGADGEQYRWQIGPPEIRYYWTVHITGVRLSWFRAGGGQAGVDPHLRIGIATDLECLFRRFKPAHTEVIFDYSEALSP